MVGKLNLVGEVDVHQGKLSEKVKRESELVMWNLGDSTAGGNCRDRGIATWRWERVWCQKWKDQSDWSTMSRRRMVYLEEPGQAMLSGFIFLILWEDTEISWVEEWWGPIYIFILRPLCVTWEILWNKSRIEGKPFWWPGEREESV